MGEVVNYTSTGLPGVERPAVPVPSEAELGAWAAGIEMAEGLRPPVQRPRYGGPEAGRIVVLDLLGNDPDWQERAACRETDPEAFFPEKGGSTREAKRICSRCEVKGECLEYALGHDERFGIWGGLSERERRRLKRRGA